VRPVPNRPSATLNEKGTRRLPRRDRFQWNRPRDLEHKVAGCVALVRQLSIGVLTLRGIGLANSVVNGRRRADSTAEAS